MKGAYEKAVEAAECFEGFVKEHPVEVGVFCTVLAIGVLVVLAPQCLGWLGFEEVGILEGKSIVSSFPVPFLIFFFVSFLLLGFS